MVLDKKNNAIKTCYSGKSWTSKDNFTCTSYNKNNLYFSFILHSSEIQAWPNGNYYSLPMAEGLNTGSAEFEASRSWILECSIQEPYV